LHDVFLMYADIDSDYAKAMSRYLTAQGLRTLRDDRAIFADTPEDFQRFEKLISSCHATALLLSNASLQQMDRGRETSSSVVQVGTGRTRSTLGLCRSKEVAARMAEWGLPTCAELGDWDPHSPAAPPELVGRLNELTVGPHSGSHWVGLPVIVAAMT